jgi:hypothetical protein
MNSSNDLSRRDLGKLAAAALGGAVLGSLALSASAAEEASLLLGEKHVCCGLNTCKGENGGKKNDCAGQGHCATTAKHTCSGENACKGQGGCGEHPGENACKGKGSCNVPLEAKAWKKARPNFEAAMTKAGKKFGPAPADCGK